VCNGLRIEDCGIDCRFGCEVGSCGVDLVVRLGDERKTGNR
jgi:hypothetical protein